MKWLAVTAGGGIGSLIRYLIGTALAERCGARFPLGTFLINISGSFLMGVLMTLLTERYAPHPYWRLLFVTGVLGGYTTFSSFEYETFQSVRFGNHWVAIGYVFGSVILGYIGVWLGVSIASRR